MMKMYQDLSTVISEVTVFIILLLFFSPGICVLPRDDSEEKDHMRGTELQKKCDAKAIVGTIGVAVGKGSEQVKYHE